MKHKIVFFSIGILTALVTLVSGCTSGSASTLDRTSAATGRLIVNITDAPAAPEIDEVWLTVSKVQVHDDSTGWREVGLVGDARFNLLLFTGGLQAKLAAADLTAGKYTQIRMDVSPVELHIKGEAVEVFHEAKLPSGTLKFNHPFEIVGGEDTEILFDFDALKSVNVTGNNKYMFKPVINLTTTKQPKGKFEITTPSLPNGVVGAYTSPALATTGGVAPYVWSLESVTPVNAANVLSIDSSTGAISGTFGVAGNYALVVKVTEGSVAHKSATKTFNIEIAASGALQIITTSLPDGTEDVAYPAYTLVAVNVTGAYSWTSADLPAGLTLSTSGSVSGTITEPGDYSFTVTLTDTVTTDSQIITLRINEAP